MSQGTKALIVKAKLSGAKQFIMVVVPGDRQFDVKKLRNETGYKDVRFALEQEVSDITQGVLPGGVPPFGNLFGLIVVADEKVFMNEKIIFNAGDRRVSIAMRSEDYRELVHPQVADITP
jgi:prolyl-tRNA editing enzyme YbaK/EbsC (Cys-tRNA(Pro) deacylase)